VLEYLLFSVPYCSLLGIYLGRNILVADWEDPSPPVDSVKNNVMDQLEKEIKKQRRKEVRLQRKFRICTLQYQCSANIQYDNLSCDLDLKRRYINRQRTA
jgi:hypothetical protein